MKIYLKLYKCNKLCKWWYRYEKLNIIIKNVYKLSERDEISLLYTNKFNPLIIIAQNTCLFFHNNHLIINKVTRFLLDYLYLIKITKW